jgi:cellulose synthase/poly-beta-1,6-N-acetylglucosamine synthase-like glycosyltransferase
MFKALLLAIVVAFSVDSLLRFLLLLLRAVVKRKAARPLATGTEIGGCIVLIAARDEAGTIGPTLESLRPQLDEWPDSSLWVIADQCSDTTAKEAKKNGAYVAERSPGEIGKGAAIRWWIENFRDQWTPRSTILLLDADSRLRAGSLSSLRGAIGSGAVAAQCFVAPRASGATSRLAGWSEVLMQRIDDEARSRLGFSVPLRGAGSALSAGVLAELSPRLHTFAEDLELDVLLAARPARVDFVPDAVVLDPKPPQEAGVSRQRTRWFEGQLQVLRDYWREIARALVHGRRGTWLLLPLLFLRPKTAFIALRVMILVMALLWGPRSAVVIVAAALAMDVSYYFGGVLVVDDRRRYLTDLLSAPRYAGIWLYSLGGAIFSRGRKAERRSWLRAGRD